MAMNSNEKKILILTSAAHYLTHFFALVFPVLVMPISRDLSMEPADVIQISFPMYLCYGLLAMPWEYLTCPATGSISGTGRQTRA